MSGRHRPAVSGENICSRILNSTASAHRGLFSYYYDNMVFTSRWYSQYPPGHSFLLMMGVLCNTPWIINPLLRLYLQSCSISVLYFMAMRTRQN